MLILDAQATAKINVFNRNACRLDSRDQIEHPVEGVEVGRRLKNLRADVAINADDPQAPKGSCIVIHTQGIFMGHAKLVVLQARGDVGVGFRIHIGIDANADGCAQAQLHGHAGQDLQLGFAFDIKAANASGKGLAHFCACLAYPRENDFANLATCGQNPIEFAARHNVKTASGSRKHLKHAEC